MRFADFAVLILLCCADCTVVASWHYADYAIALIRCIPSCAGQQYVFFLADVFVLVPWLVPWLVPLAGAFGWCLWLVPFAGAFRWCLWLVLCRAHFIVRVIHHADFIVEAIVSWD